MKSIRSRLVAGLGLIIVFFLIQAALVWWGQDSVRRDVVDATRKNTIASSQLSELAVLAQQIRRYEKEYFVYVGNQEKREGYIKEWSGVADRILALLQKMNANADKSFNEDDKTKINNWAGAADFYTAEMRKIFGSVNDQAARVLAAPPAPAAAPTPAKSAPAVSPTEVIVMFSPVEVNGMIGPGKDRFSGVLIKGVSEMSGEKTKQTLALSGVAADGFQRLLVAVLATVAVGILVALALMLTLPQAVTRPLADLTASIDDMSKGNLTVKLQSGGIAEFDGIAKALERMRVGQQALVARLRK